ncbi:hypothetical protein CYLTODRAFT_493593 [Cylindrobasidium torrendii FP15055 ss-10]|uniref:Uncharacterized protein n=1 Tax=Cylindrobasidium torrendii FP15055 ss-10 TaxID=1314674 RepID=A0A0D7B2U4_9AGAR|nr:hypothetical protein CYLTODRAFT_493593 [Cylindrobasidium torrendii FP15055 ss-10]
MSSNPSTQQALPPQIQRARKGQIGTLHREASGNNVHRENSPSPSSLRPRAAKSQSMPMMPSAVQIFASAQQSNGNGTNGNRRTPPTVQRGLPTPPGPPLASPPDERRSMSPSPTQPGVTHYPRPINRVQPQQFLQKFHDGHDWQMTDEILADIERADQQQQVAQVYFGNGNDMPAIQDPSKFSPKDLERRATSPAYHTPMGTPGENVAPAPSYVQYNRDQHLEATKKTAAPSLATQTPPLQAIHTRSPDRSLPVQEEQEDERESSPTPSSDLHPEGNSGRSRSSRDDNDNTLIDSDLQSSEEQFTPRSPSSTLPEPTYQNKRSNRTGANDASGLRGLDDTVYDAHGRRLDAPKQPLQEQHMNKPDMTRPSPMPMMHPDDLINFMDNPTSAYLANFYARSPRPDGPIPPTPLSQTNPPSPSPLMSAAYDLGHNLPPGSPYPYPFAHVRRVPAMHSQPQRNAVEVDHAQLQEQFARQWQVFAQNNAPSDLTDSTLSPSGTPFPPTWNFNPWAYWHTQRLLGNRAASRTMSMRSSPSHEPVGLPPRKVIKKKMTSVDLRQPQPLAPRKPPPRVDSTQPRDTSPEPDSSGEETPSEGHYAAHDEEEEEQQWHDSNTPPGSVTVQGDDEDGEWVDEEDDEEDLLDLEYHPSYVMNIEKRRRRWEIRWDALVQAFQALDRQTDSTMVLMAQPSHSSKMHILQSRSVRRLPGTASLPMKASFKQIASQRKAARTARFSERIVSPTTDGGSDDSVRRALAAVESLGSLWEARWVEEQRKWREDQMRVEVILRQLLGEASGSPRA